MNARSGVALFLIAIGVAACIWFASRSPAPPILPPPTPIAPMPVTSAVKPSPLVQRLATPALNGMASQQAAISNVENNPATPGN